MLALSTILLQHHDLSTFERLVMVVREHARRGETFLAFDVRPPFADTPDNWQDLLEAAFTATIRE